MRRFLISITLAASAVALSVTTVFADHIGSCC